MFNNGRFHVLDFEVYGAGCLHLILSCCENNENAAPNGPALYVARADVRGRICFLDDVGVGRVFETEDASAAHHLRTRRRAADRARTLGRRPVRKGL